MYRWISTLVLACLMVGQAGAEAPKMLRLSSGIEASDWEGVGRIRLGDGGFCTGALIAPEIVLTAAHCLYNKTTGERIDLDQVEFMAGWREGRASAYRNIKRAVTHPDYDHAGEMGPDQVRTDMALLELVHPIRDGRIRPFETARHIAEGSHIGVVSYAEHRSEAPSLQEVCDVLTLRDGVLVSSCSVDFGASGAPIFAFRNGKAQIVSVVSAKAQMHGDRVALGAALDAGFDHLLLALEHARQNSFGAGPIELLHATQSRSGTGAKFVSP